MEGERYQLAEEACLFAPRPSTHVARKTENGTAQVNIAAKIMRRIRCRACASGACGSHRVTEDPHTLINAEMHATKPSRTADAERDLEALLSLWMKRRGRGRQGG